MLLDRRKMRAQRVVKLPSAQDPFEVIDLIIEELQNEKKELIREAIQQGNPSLLEPAIKNILARSSYSVRGKTQQDLEKMVLDHVLGYGPAQEWIERPDFVGYFINAPDDVWVQLGAERRQLDFSFVTPAAVKRYIERITGNLPGEVNEDEPVSKFFDERSNLRILIGIAPIAYLCPTCVIRKQPEDPLDLDGLVKAGTLNPQMATDLRRYLQEGLNITISGIQGAGKTTMLRALAEEVPLPDRMLVMEDHPELKLRRRGTVQWLTKKLSKGKKVGLETLTNLGLLGSFEYYVFGEIRDGDAFYFFNGAFAGNRTLNTGHAKSSAETLNRLRINMKMAGVQMADADLREILYKSIDVIVYMDKFVVREIAEVDGDKQEIRPVWVYDPAKKTWKGREVHSLTGRKGAKGKHETDAGTDPDGSVDGACG